MASIKKNKNGTYDCWIQKAGYKKIRRRFPNKTLAEKWSKKVESEMNEGRFVPEGVGKKKTLKDAIHKYVVEILPKNADATVSTDGPRLTWWEKRAGHLHLHRVTNEIVAEARSVLENTGSGAEGKGPCSSTTTRKYLMILRRVFNVVVKDWKWLRAVPFDVDLPKPNPAKERYLSVEEQGRLLAACKESGSELLFNLVLILLRTGARYGEIAKLKWKDVDLKQSRIVLEAAGTKSKRSRTLFLVGDVLEVFKQMSTNRIVGTEYVFPSPSNIKKPIGYLEKAWQRVVAKAELTGVRIHDLRHTFASRMLQEGISLAELSLLLGHSDFGTTQRYSHLDADRLQERVIAIAAKAFGG